MLTNCHFYGHAHRNNGPECIGSEDLTKITQLIGSRPILGDSGPRKPARNVQRRSCFAEVRFLATKNVVSTVSTSKRTNADKWKKRHLI